MTMSQKKKSLIGDINIMGCYACTKKFVNINVCVNDQSMADKETCFQTIITVGYIAILIRGTEMTSKVI